MDKKCKQILHEGIWSIKVLEKMTHPDIYAVHQCARFTSDPRELHKQAVLRIGRYLLVTREEGIIFKTGKEQNMELWYNGDFCGNWMRDTVHVNKTTAKSRTGYEVMYAGCLVTWASKMQTEVALITTEVELIAMSEGLRMAISLMNLRDKMAEQGIR